ncbi:MAG TPA: ankyrin repeat domain-containing protein [Nitrospira sp.]|nr:ankyrin repeat domain-containing protein [Nitrospira sp.]
MLSPTSPTSPGSPFNGMKSVVRRLIPAMVLLSQVGCAVPLLSASASGDTKAVLLLLDEGHHANESFPVIGTRPLMLAAAHGHRETVEALLDAGADVNAEDLTGWTALHAGAYKGDIPTVSLLLERGARPKKARWFLKSPSNIAEMLDHQDLVPILRGAEVPSTDLAQKGSVPSPEQAH